MERRITYACSLCHIATPALVSELPEPKTLVSADTAKTLRDVAEAKRKLGVEASDDPVDDVTGEVLDSLARDVLVHAVCPACGERNPAGLEERAASRRRTRIIGAATCLPLALAAWLWPAGAYVVVAIVLLVTVLTLVIIARNRPVRWLYVASNLAIAGAAVAIAWRAPWAIAGLPLFLAVRFALSKSDDGPWLRAQQRVRFEKSPYR